MVFATVFTLNSVSIGNAVPRGIGFAADPLVERPGSDQGGPGCRLQALGLSARPGRCLPAHSGKVKNNIDFNNL
jgi:hypothetical protein